MRSQTIINGVVWVRLWSLMMTTNLIGFQKYELRCIKYGLPMYEPGDSLSHKHMSVKIINAGNPCQGFSLSLLQPLCESEPEISSVCCSDMEEGTHVISNFLMFYLQYFWLQVILKLAIHNQKNLVFKTWPMVTVFIGHIPHGCDHWTSPIQVDWWLVLKGCSHWSGQMYFLEPLWT